MHVGGSRASLSHSLLTLVVLAASPALSYAQGHDGHAPGTVAQAHTPTREESAVIKAVQDATARFKNVTSVDGPGEGYALNFGCVSGGDFGAMGMHFVNTGLIGDLEVDPTNPEIVIYEPQADGSLRLIGADFLIFADAWDQAHPDGATPQLMGQLFHRFEAPNRFGLPSFYTLHVWAWKTNPTGTYTNWHSGVSCDAFGGERP